LGGQGFLATFYAVTNNIKKDRHTAVFFDDLIIASYLPRNFCSADDA
jgi:hypothetical protein